MWKIWWMNNKKKVYAAAGVLAAIGLMIMIAALYGWYKDAKYFFETEKGDIGVAVVCRGERDGLYCWKKYNRAKVKVKRYWRNP